ncbi:Endopolyphosphatase [Mortierella sp. GBA43]|nr:Endopolyphosphatase [Mortierella sp. GBA43]
MGACRRDGAVSKDLRHHRSQNTSGVPARTSRVLKSRSTGLLLACCCMLSLSLSSSSFSLSSSSSPWFAAAQTVRPPHSSSTDPDDYRLTGRFLHITDIHPDQFYIDGGSVTASCHRVTSDDDEDARNRPGRRGGVGGLYGAPYSICDSPFSLANATFGWIDKNLIGKIDFVVWTGDNARHDSDNEHPRTQKEIEDLNREIAKKFLDTFAPDENDPFQQRIPIVPSIGNNDIYPHNIMDAGPNRILQHFSEIWADFIPESQYHTFQNGGYYSVEVIPGKVTVVSLNTLYFFNQNAAVDGCKAKDEPGTNQMDWLEVELDNIRARNMSVYLTGHIPPARKSYSTSCLVRYTKLALKNQDIIVGHLFGHANIDHFFILSKAGLKAAEEQLLLEEMEAERAERALMAAATRFGGSDRITSLELFKARAREDAIATAIANDVPFDRDYDPFHILGLNAYLTELWEQYSGIPKTVKNNNYAVVFVSPSVVPTYNPSLRVFEYQLDQNPNTPDPNTPGDDDDDGDNGDDDDDDDNDDDGEDDVSLVTTGNQVVFKDSWSSHTSSEMALEADYDFDTDCDEYDHDEEYELEYGEDMTTRGEEDGGRGRKGKKPRRRKPRRKPRRRPYPAPAPPSRFGYPLSYTQYWVNLTKFNEEDLEPVYEIEYGTREDWGLQYLGVNPYLDLAKQIVGDEQVKERYLAWMVVQTGARSGPDDDDFFNKK